MFSQRRVSWERFGHTAKDGLLDPTAVYAREITQDLQKYRAWQLNSRSPHIYMLWLLVNND